MAVLRERFELHHEPSAKLYIANHFFTKSIFLSRFEIRVAVHRKITRERLKFIIKHEFERKHKLLVVKDEEEEKEENPRSVQEGCGSAVDDDVTEIPR